MVDKLGQFGDRVQNEFDRRQQRVPVLAFPISVWLRYREDRCYEYAPLLSYYGFFSIFPLLTAGVTISGFILADNPELRAELLDTIFARVPVVGEALATEVVGLEGSGIVLIVAIGFTLWSGIGVVRAAQNAFNTMWSISIMQWPSFFWKLLRAVVAVVVLGTAILTATILSVLATFAFDLPGIERFAGVVVAMIVNAGALLIIFKVLTVSEVGWRSLVPGALIGGVGLWLLQLLGGAYIEGVVLGAGDVYGSFAMAMGLLVWLALLARVVLLASEVNVVAAKHLWPRSFTGANLADADQRSFEEVRTRSIRKLEESDGSQSSSEGTPT